MANVVARTKAAVRRWAGLGPDAALTLGDTLDTLRSGGKDALLVEVNTEFTGERSFPIAAQVWDGLDLKNVGDVHRECAKRVEG